MTDLNALRDRIGDAAATNGWHDRWNAMSASYLGSRYEVEELIDHTVAKTALIACEVSEAIEEIRDGHGLTETYYTVDGNLVTHVDEETPVKFFHYLDADGDETCTNGLPKPEGFPSELADVIIRTFDLCAMLNIDIQKAVDEKLAYNATRGHMHGGKTV